MKVCEETVLCNECAVHLLSENVFGWKYGKYNKSYERGSRNVTWQFCPFFHVESSDGVSEELLPGPISTLSYSRTGSCSLSAFFALSHSVSQSWHAFCHARKWQTNDISHAAFTQARPNGAKIMAPRWHHAHTKSFPCEWAKQNESISHFPASGSCLLPIWAKKTILISFSISRDPQ